ncbi:type II secretion system protein [Halobacteriovorax sp. ZH2_bin.1]|uniref:type II secretion system protein n=1 Tax=unclassified Halobacteriovorax TaxID=2639665 RepID=UPI00371B133D
MFKFLGNEKGFTLAEIMVAIGIISVAALAFQNITASTSKLTRQTRLNQELINVRTSASSMLLNTDSCNNTLGIGTTLTEGMLLDSIQNRLGDKVINVLDKYSNNRIIVESIEIGEIDSGIDSNGLPFAETELIISFQKKISVDKIASVKHNIPITVELDASGKMKRCYSAEENAALTAERQICESYKGKFDVATRDCYHVSYMIPATDPSMPPSPRPPADDEMVTTSYLEEFKNLFLENEYVNIEGDTMKGELESPEGYCIAGKCRKTFADQSCKAGQVMNGLNEDGTLQCATPTCSDPKTFYVGLNSDGSAKCKKFPDNSCGLDQYVAKVNDDGSVECVDLPPDPEHNCTTVNGKPGALARISSSDNHICVELESYYGKDCPIGEYMNGFKADGAPNCVKFGVNIVKKNCSWSTTVSSKDGWIESSCPLGKYRFGTYFDVGVGTGRIFLSNDERTSKFNAKGDRYYLRSLCCEMEGTLISP